MIRTERCCYPLSCRGREPTRSVLSESILTLLGADVEGDVLFVNRAFPFGLSGFAQNPSTQEPSLPNKPIIKSADLEVDATVLRRAYEELHPGLYRYSKRAEMDANFEALQRDLSRDLSLQDAYLSFSRFAALVKCGHTYPNFFNQKSAVAAALFQGHNRVPFYFRWLDQKMVFTKDFTAEHRLPPGTAVLSINGTPVRGILDRLMTIARADGSNDAKRVAYLEIAGDSIYEAFRCVLSNVLPSEEHDAAVGRTAPE